MSSTKSCTRCEGLALSSVPPPANQAAFARSSAMSMSSWPPTNRRLPHSIGIWRTSELYCAAAFSTWRRNEE